LPAEATSFIGRSRELAELRKTLASARLVSLVGAGGVGKTRLALHMAAELRRPFRDGAWLVELDKLQDPTLVSKAVLTALDLRDQATPDPLGLVLSYLSGKHLLLLIDNCEHVLETAAGLVSEILKAAPRVRVLCTSREPLSIPGEYVVQVPPLALPDDGVSAPIEQLHRNEAMQLFTERAAAASGNFQLTAANRAAVVELCRRLDGLPLAIELAAVRTRVLTVQQILQLLTDRFALLTGGSRAALPRHRTLQTAIEWSHDLLDSEERIVLRRLSVFGGRFTLPDAESVCAPDVLPTLVSLVEKSLVLKQDAKAIATYRLHETMREFARLKLRDAAEEEEIESRSAEYYWSRCRQSAQEAQRGLVTWLEWMDLEIDNVRLVLRNCVLRGDVERGLHIAIALGWYWITRATAEGARWLDQFHACGEGTPHSYFLRGFLGVLLGDPLAARTALARAAAAARASGDRRLLVESLAMGSVAEGMAGEHAPARRLLEDAHASLAEGDVLGKLACLQGQALNGFFERDFETVRSAAAEGVRISRETGDLYRLEVMLLNRGGVALIDGDTAAAKTDLEAALRIAQQIDDRVAQFFLVSAQSLRAAMAGDPRVAARLLGASETLRIEVGTTTNPALASLVATARQLAVAALGDAQFDGELRRGASYHRSEAIALALDEVAPADSRASTADTPLGAREGDVARLVAEGLTNKQIGAQLFISERTVETHVRNILRKLGFTTRAQIAGWIAASNG
jgi:predicted ATPase/DNA-binding CsgD family transcriptional regulator